MKLIPIDQCPAGPWLDTAAAKAMGWKVYEAEYNGSTWIAGPLIDPPGIYATLMGNYVLVTVGDKSRRWNPSQDIAAAWSSLRNSLIERSDVASVYVYNDGGEEFCEIERIYVDEEEGLVMASDDELAATAIARAFCKFHGITEVKIRDD